MRDSSHFMEWGRFLEVTESAGFAKLSRRTVEYERGLTNNFIAVRSPLLLHATSVSAQKIRQLDSGRVYGSILPSDAQEFKYLCKRNNLSYEPATIDGRVFFSFDIRQGILRLLKDFRESGVQLTDWPPNHPVPRLLDIRDRTPKKHITDNSELWRKIKPKLKFVP